MVVFNSKFILGTAIVITQSEHQIT